MIMTEDMKRYPEKYFKYMKRVSGSRATLENFTRILREYYNARGVGETGIFIHLDRNSAHYGSTRHLSPEKYVRIELPNKNKIGGEIL